MRTPVRMDEARDLAAALLVQVGAPSRHAALQAGLLTIDDYLAAVRLSPAQNPTHPVAVPGDGARKRRSAALHNGLAIDAGLWSTLSGARVPPPPFPALQDAHS